MNMGMMSAVSVPRAKLLLWCIAVLALSLGCHAERDDEPSPEELAQFEGPPQIVTVPDPSGSYFAEVRASGTGCPPGTWNTRVADDALAFTITFSSYTTEVNPQVAITARDCELSIKLHTPNGRSFSVQAFSYSGYALLQPGVTGKQTASYFFQGNQVPPMESNRTDLKGPFDKEYKFEDSIPITAREWSACGVERELKIQTRVQLNNAERRSGYMNLSAVDGSRRLFIKLEARSCSATMQPTSPGDPGALQKPRGVSVTPSSVATGQPFSISWEPVAERPFATYQVQLRSPIARGSELLWESPEIGGRFIAYNGFPIAEPGAYQVTVIVRDAGQQAVSYPVVLTVGESTAPVDPPPPPPQDARVPAWARPLIGRYAMRIDSYTGTAVGLITSNEAVSLAEITEEDGELVFRERSCSQTATALGTNLALRTPQAYPPVVRKISLESGNRWRTDDHPIGVGYDREGIPACRGRIGQSIPKRPHQDWIRGSTCRCRDVEDAPLIDDCRVTDPDDDGFPGVAFQWGGLTASDSWVSHTAIVARSHFVRGRVDAEGAHTAAVKIDETSFQYVCEPSSRCTFSFASRPCTPDYNTVRFARLPNPPPGQSSWTCASVLANRSRFFPRASPAPLFCAQETPTDAR